MDKKTLRSMLKVQRETYVKEHADVGFAAQFLHTFKRYVVDHHLDLSQCVTALYYPFGPEASPLKILEHLLDQGLFMSLPKMQGENIIFVRYTKDTALYKNNFGFYEPASSEEVVPDIMLLPLLGFDREGHRLGYGKGHYDKTISTLPTTPHLIGLAYPFQEVDFLPTEPHDKKLDAVLLPESYRVF